MLARPEKAYARPANCRWEPVFGDEFNGRELDRDKWNTAYGSGGNGERQAYVPDAFELERGRVRIRAEQREQDGYAYTSGILHTEGRAHFLYGAFEIRARIPAGQGFFPAFWLLAARRENDWELDVFENLGHDRRLIYFSNHWRDEAGHQALTAPFAGPDFSLGFHTFRVEWFPEKLVWKVDGVERHRSDQGVPAAPMFLLANLAVGGNWPGNPDETTQFPAHLEIDYIRAYEQVCPTSLQPDSIAR